MLIQIRQTARDWIYSMRLSPVVGYNYCGATAFKLAYGHPEGKNSFNGIMLCDAYSVDRNCTRYATTLSSPEASWATWDISGVLEDCIRHVLWHLDTFYPGEFYRRRTSSEWGPQPLMHNWVMQPVLDERLWQRYVDTRR